MTETGPGRPGPILPTLTTLVVLAAALLPAPEAAHGELRAPAPGPPTVAAGAKTGGDPAPLRLHITQGREVGLTHQMSDGAGYRWDIQRYGNVGQGGSNAYSGGLHCRIHNSRFRSNTSSGRLNQAGDELEIGPYQVQNLRVYRRIKVYKDRGLARWLDIFENTTSQAIAVPVNIQTNVSYRIQQVHTSSGAAAFGAKDWAFITQSSGRNSPTLMHLLCGSKSRVRPVVTAQQHQIQVNWNLTVPAGKVAILCYFEAQNNSIDTLQKQMKSFRPYKALKDLPPEVRRHIVNWSTGDYAGLDLSRAESSDTVIVFGDRPKYGTVTNDSFDVLTYCGAVKLPAARVVGMASVKGEAQNVRFVLVDGQIVSGRSPDGKLTLQLPTGGSLQMPFDRIKEWSFRISPQRPSEVAFNGPYVLLRTGDRLIFDSDAQKLSFHTRHGTVPLQPAALLRVSMNNPDNAVHRAFFLNGSRLAGLLAPEKILLKLQLGLTVEAPREMLSGLHFAAEEKANPELTSLKLSNEDELFGQLGEEALTVRSEFGTVQVKPDNIKTIDFVAAHAELASLGLWDGTVLRGRIGRRELAFQIVPGPTLRINPAQFVRLVSPRALPPDHVIKKVRDLIAQLGAESYKDRQAATEVLAKMGKTIAPILREHLTDPDPEVRQRLEDILDGMGPPPPVPRPPARNFGVIR